MDCVLKFAVILMLLVLSNAAFIKHNFSHCENVVKTWALSSVEQVREDRHTLRDLLFFLHVPRTGGRTYFHCFLKQLYSNSEECPHSYDKLQFDPSKQKCRVLVTHDDYSMVSKLPKERSSVVTIQRNPVDRVLSTYEFSIEVAARFLVHPNLISATQVAGHLRSKTHGASTLDIWPWKYLVPWMRQDLIARRDARKCEGSNDVMSNNPYDMQEIVKPLHEYINDPIVHEIVHNGATFQVAGLTNNSYFEESHEVRHCVQKYKILGKHVLEVAKRRLDDMLYVGLTEDHRESATMFANIVGAQVIAQNSLISDSEHDHDDQQKTRTSDQKSVEHASIEDAEWKKENITVENLMDPYEDCISSLRKTQARRRNSSLERIAPANFSKEDRLKISEDVIEQIRLFNDLDLELYKYAQDIFAKQHKHTVQTFHGREGLKNMFINSGDITLWRILALAMFIVSVLTLFFVTLRNSRKRTSKVKI